MSKIRPSNSVPCGFTPTPATKAVLCGLFERTTEHVTPNK